MKCTYCGRPFKAGQKFCGSCGAPAMPDSNAAPVMNSAEPAFPNLDGNMTSTASKTESMLVGIVTILAVIVLLIVTLTFLSSVGGGVDTDVLEDQWEAVEDCDGKDFIGCMLPEEILENAIEQTNFLDKQDVYDMVEAALEEQVDELSLDYGSDLDFEVRIVDKEKADKDTIEELNDLTELYYDMKIETAYEVDYDVTLSGDAGRDTESYECLLYEYDGDWYVWDVSFLQELT